MQNAEGVAAAQRNEDRSGGSPAAGAVDAGFSGTNTAFDFAAAVAVAEHQLVTRLGLAPLPLPSELTGFEGSWKGGVVSLSARAYRGPGVAYARFVSIEGGNLDLGNLLVLSDTALPVPMLGADLVGLDRDTGAVLVDLSPVPGGDAAGLDASALEELKALALPSGTPPEWCRPWLSPAAVCTRVTLDQAAAARSALLVFCHDFVRAVHEVTAAPKLAPQVAQWQRRYCAAHRGDERGLRLVHEMFGAARAERFLHQVLFPESVIT